MYRAVRFSENPLLHSGMDPRIGTNLNGPSLIRVPEWVAAPLGRYYLYFAHHQGTFIRMAYADEVCDPALYREEDKTWLLYSAAGESSICGAELTSREAARGG